MAFMGLYISKWYFPNWNEYVRVVRIFSFFDRAPMTVEVSGATHRRREVVIRTGTEEWGRLLALLRDYRRTAANINAVERGALEELMAYMGSFHRLTK